MYRYLYISCACTEKELLFSQRLLRRVVLDRTPSYLASGPLTPLRAPRTASTVNPAILDALYAIKTTPYESSFLSRLQGFSPSPQSGVIAIDWDTRSPWMELMSDIRDHYSLAQYVCVLSP